MHERPSPQRRRTQLRSVSAETPGPEPGTARQQWNSGKRYADQDELVVRLDRMRILADAVRHP